MMERLAHLIVDPVRRARRSPQENGSIRNEYGKEFPGTNSHRKARYSYTTYYTPGRKIAIPLF
jgi:hypothetical protein